MPHQCRYPGRPGTGARIASLVRVGSIEIGNDLPFVLIAGPCQLESRAHAFDMAGRLKDITGQLGIGFIFKSSFDKANRTSIAGKRGVGIWDGLAILQDIAFELKVPVTTDFHTAEQCSLAVQHDISIIQIPALLSRQTDLIVAAAKTGLPVNIKKGQFMAPGDMAHAAEKVRAAGNPDVLLTERGTSFGYNALVSDMRSLPIMAAYGPVIFDATHSVQAPAGLGSASGGDRSMVPVLARAAVAAGVAGLFIETHDDPDNAPSDGPVMLPIGQMRALLEHLQAIDRVVKHQ